MQLETFETHRKIRIYNLNKIKWAQNISEFLPVHSNVHYYCMTIGGLNFVYDGMSHHSEKKLVATLFTHPTFPVFPKRVLYPSFQTNLGIS